MRIRTIVLFFHLVCLMALTGCFNQGSNNDQQADSLIGEQPTTVAAGDTGTIVFFGQDRISFIVLSVASVEVLGTEMTDDAGNQMVANDQFIKVVMQVSDESQQELRIHSRSGSTAGMVLFENANDVSYDLLDRAITTQEPQQVMMDDDTMVGDLPQQDTRIATDSLSDTITYYFDADPATIAEGKIVIYSQNIEFRLG